MKNCLKHNIPTPIPPSGGQGGLAFILPLLLFLLCSCGADHYMKKGEKYFAIGEYYDAAAEFKTAYGKTPAKEKAKRGERAAKLAYCYDRINSTPESHCRVPQRHQVWQGHTRNASLFRASADEKRQL